MARSWTLSLASVAGAVRPVWAAVDSRDTAGAVENGVGGGSTTAADVRERAGAGGTSGCTIETEANWSILGWLTQRLSMGTVTLGVVGAGADKTVRFSKARKSNCPKL